jgi:HsdM N-terminal domain
MLTGEIRSQIDQVWNAFWSGGISNPLEVIEQITYLHFLKRLDEQEIAEELKANREKKPMQKRFFPDGKDNKKRSFQDYRWNRFKNFDPRDMYTVISEHVFPWLRTFSYLLELRLSPETCARRPSPVPRLGSQPAATSPTGSRTGNAGQTGRCNRSGEKTAARAPESRLRRGSSST